MANINQGVLDGVRRIGAKVRDLTVDGIGGAAPLGFRLRGATTLGPPASGTWKAGDEIRDRAGSIWICTAGGTGPAASWAKVPGGVVTAAQMMAQPVVVVSHRGLPQVAPEHTIAAYQSSIAAMWGAGYVPAVKLDVYTLTDGAEAVMHDSAVDRTTTSTGNASAWSAAAWQTLQCPAGTLVGPAWGNVPLPLLSDVLDTFGGRCVFFIEPKTGTGEIGSILKLVTALNLQSSVVMIGEETTLAGPALAKAAGVGWWYYWNQHPVASAPTPATVAATPGVTAMGIAIDPFSNGTNYTDADVATVVSAATSAGMRAFGFSYYRRASWARAAAAGITMHAVNDLYTAGSTAQRTSDGFTLGSPAPGEIGSFGPTTGAGNYGMTTPPTSIYVGGTGNWRRQINGNVPSGGGGLAECLGFLGPAAAPGGIYTFGLTIFWDATETGNSLGDRWAGGMAGCTDDLAWSTNPTVNGYGFLIRQGNGSTFSSPTMQIFKNTRGAYQNNGTYASGTSSQLGSNVTCTTGYAGPNTLGASYANGAVITSLTLGTPVTIPSGMKIALPNGQVATVSGVVTASTSVTISSLTLTSALAYGQPVSFGIPCTVKVDCSVGGTTTITFKRTDTADTLTASDSSSPYSGGYVHIAKSGTGTGSTLAVSFANLTIA